MKYQPGTLILTLKGELDSDEHDNERHTPPDTWGWISSVNSQSERSYNVWFASGAWVVIDEDELADAKAYRVATPERIAASLNAIHAFDTALNESEEAPSGDSYNRLWELLP